MRAPVLISQLNEETDRSGRPGGPNLQLFANAIPYRFTPPRGYCDNHAVPGRSPGSEGSLLRYLRIISLASLFAMLGCGRIGKIGAGTYSVADQEYTSQNYAMERSFLPTGTFEERHVVDHCLRLELSGRWLQDGGRLQLSYDRSHSRANCHDSLPAWAVDTSKLEIPIRKVAGTGYEALLAASDGKPEKWIQWIRTD
jgi:hypothetical protein